MRYLLPLALLAGLAACAPYQPDYAYQTTTYQPAYGYNDYGSTYNNGYYTPPNSYSPASTGGFGSCEQAPFVWKACPQPPVD
jgi:hypothetical protein